MPDAQGRPYARDIAERIGIKVSDWRARVHRGHAPAALDYVNKPIGRVGSVVCAVWDPAVIEAYVAHREVRLSQQVSRPNVIECPHDDCDEAVQSWPALSEHVKTSHPRRN
jgi:hypothetical protein